MPAARACADSDVPEICGVIPVRHGPPRMILRARLRKPRSPWHSPRAARSRAPEPPHRGPRIVPRSVHQKGFIRPIIASSSSSVSG